MPPLSSIAAAGPVVIDLALIAGLTAFFIGTIKPLVALKLDAASTAYDSALQLLTVGSAAGLICMAQYAPTVFAIVAPSVAVAAGAMGGYRVVKGAARQDPASDVPPTWQTIYPAVGGSGTATTAPVDLTPNEPPTP